MAIEQVLTPDELAEFRAQGLSFREIGKRIGFSARAVGDYAHRCLTPAHWRRRHKGERLQDVLPPEKLAEWRRAGASYVEIAGRVGWSSTWVRRYTLSLFPDGVPPAPDPRRCTRCDFLSEPDNPIGDDGLCLWCRKELAGVDLHEWFKSGKAQEEIAALMKENK